MQSQFAELYEKSFQSITPGDVVTGTIIEVRPKDVVVDIGYKAEGILTLDEFVDATSLAAGQEIEVLFEGFDDR